MKAGPPAGVSAVVRFLGEHAGLRFPADRGEVVSSAVERAVRAAGAADANALLREARAESEARDELIAELTVGESHFFRDRAQLALVAGGIADALRERQAAGATVRVWSAGCATGEEPYSLAIALVESGLDPDKLHVLGTDLSRRRLALAARARYRKWSLRGVADDEADRWFTIEEGAYVVRPEFRRLVEFRYLNLVEDRYPSPSTGVWGMDLILCRNVLIYFDRQAVAAVAPRLIASLHDAGWLLLGASDPSIQEAANCRVELTRAGLVYRAERGEPPSRLETRAGPETRVGLETARPAAAPAPRAAPLERGTDAAPAGESVASPKPPSWPGAPAEPASTGATDHEPAQDASEREALAAARSTPARAAPDPRPKIDAAPAGTGGRAEELALEEAVAAYRSADYDHARAIAAAAAPIASDDALWIVWVRSAANQGRLVEARSACDRGLERHGTSAELLYLRAILLLEAGRHDAALQAAGRALYADRTLIVAHIAAADAATRAGLQASAQRSLRNALRLLDALQPDAIVPASDGETAHRLRQLIAARHRLVAESIA